MIETMPKRFVDKVEVSGECWLWKATKNDKGYGQYYSYGKLVYAHRYSWEFFNGEITNGLNVLHRCDVPLCVNPNHLFLGTQKENMADMFSKSRQNIVRGEKNGGSKLTQAQVDEIRKLYLPGSPGVTTPFTQRKLAKKYGVASSVINGIVNNQYWKTS